MLISFKQLYLFRYKSYIFLTVLSIFFLAGCISENNKSPLKIGINQWVGNTPIYIAQEEGLFSKTPVKIHPFQSSSNTIRAFKNNLIDVASVTLDEALLLKQSNIDIQIILTSSISNGGNMIISHPQFSSIEQLKHKRIGIEKTDHNLYFLSRILEKKQLSISDFSLIHLTSDESHIAFKNKFVDAVVSYEPYLSQLKQHTSFNQIASSNDIPTEIIYVYVTKRDFLHDNKRKLQDFISGWFQAVKLLTTQDQILSSSIAKHFNLKPEYLKKSLNKVIFYSAQENYSFLMITETPNLLDTAIRLKNNMIINNLISPAVYIQNIFDSYFIREYLENSI